MSRLLILFLASGLLVWGPACAPGGVGLDNDGGDSSIGPIGDGGQDGGLPVTTSAIGRFAMGGAHSCWLSNDGVTYCWGSNVKGQLGDGTIAAHYAPKKVVDLAYASAVAGKTAQNCAIVGQGTARCWGANNLGQLGTGSSAELRTSPVDVSSVEGVTQLSVGALHVCARVAGGAVWCWGGNLSGALGRGTAGNKEQPGPVSNLTGTKDITSGTNFNCVVTAEGGVSCWGRNSQGQVGNGNTADQYSPVAVVGLPEAAAAVAAGDSHACALVASGDVYCWGANNFGQTGTGAISAEPVLTPTKVSGIDHDAVAVASASQTTCALRTGGTLACWGSNSSKQLGEVPDDNRPSAADVSGILGVEHFGVGTSHVCASTASAVYCWGSNTLGQVGMMMSDVTEVPKPTVVSFPDGVH